MNARPHHVRPLGDDRHISVDYVSVRGEAEGGGYYVADQAAILLDHTMSAPQRDYGETHLRFHALMRSVDDCAEADQVAATHLIPNLRLMEIALHESKSAHCAAAMLGVTVQALSNRISGLAGLDSELAARLWSQVSWPDSNEVQEFRCVVVDLESQKRFRRTQARKIA
ncbi:hypothetical protein [Rhodococcus sp. NPDC055024]